MRLIFLALTLCLSLTPLSAQELRFMTDFPFKIGEKLSLSINILGVYIGDQEISIEDVTSYQGRRVIVGRGRLTTNPAVSAMYRVEDTEMTYLLPEDFVPIYYERWINEGNWKDNIRFNFYPDQNKVEIAQKVNGYRKDTLEYKGVLRNYFTLISAMRAVDFDYHIRNNLPVSIDYLFGTGIKTAKFKAAYKKYDYSGRKGDSIYLQEIGGIGMQFSILNDRDRTPVRLIIPAFEVIGFKTISIDVVLRSYTRGQTDILPEGFMPTGAMNQPTPGKTN